MTRTSRWLGARGTRLLSLLGAAALMNGCTSSERKSGGAGGEAGESGRPGGAAAATGGGPDSGGLAGATSEGAGGASTAGAAGATPAGVGGAPAAGAGGASTAGAGGVITAGRGGASTAGSAGASTAGAAGVAGTGQPGESGAGGAGETGGAGAGGVAGGGEAGTAGSEPTGDAGQAGAGLTAGSGGLAGGAGEAGAAGDGGARSLAATWRVSVDSSGVEADGASVGPSMSADGRYVAFASEASNLVAGDTNGYRDVFVHDQATGATSRVSVATDGTEASGSSGTFGCAISPEGRFVAFHSGATNLVPGDTMPSDIFTHDRETGVTARVSVSSSGTEADSGSREPSISTDGRFVAFTSYATNLVSGDTNGVGDVFVRDRQAGTTTRVSVSTDGQEGDGLSHIPVITPDGRYVAFTSDASNLVANDTNAYGDVFLHDRQDGTTTRVSVGATGAQGSRLSYFPSISADGQRIAFSSEAPDLVAGDTNSSCDIFVRDRQAGTTWRVSVTSQGAEGDSYSQPGAISADGRFVVFRSYASDLVAGDTNNQRDIFVHALDTGTTTRVSVANDGSEGTGSSESAAISADGSLIAFDSTSADLVPLDYNLSSDIFVRRWR